MDDGVSVDDLLAKVESCLISHNTISIASVHEKEISAASVFYVSDAAVLIEMERLSQELKAFRQM